MGNSPIECEGSFTGPLVVRGRKRGFSLPRALGSGPMMRIFFSECSCSSLCSALPGRPVGATTWANRRVSDLALVVGKLGKREESRRDGVKRRRVRGTFMPTTCPIPPFLRLDPATRIRHFHQPNSTVCYAQPLPGFLCSFDVVAAVVGETGHPDQCQLE